MEYVIDDLDRRIVNALHGGFPLCERPYAAVAADLGIDEAGLIRRLERMLATRVLTRFGPLYNAERLGGANVLAAMRVPETEYDRATGIVNAEPAIAHNYRREHDLNMWFVGAAETPEKVETAFRRIEVATGLPVYRFPKEREYFVELKLQA